MRAYRWSPAVIRSLTPEQQVEALQAITDEANEAGGSTMTFDSLAEYQSYMRAYRGNGIR